MSIEKMPTHKRISKCPEIDSQASVFVPDWRNRIWTEKEMQSSVLLITVAIYNNWVGIGKNTSRHRLVDVPFLQGDSARSSGSYKEVPRWSLQMIRRSIDQTLCHWPGQSDRLAGSNSLDINHMAGCSWIRRLLMSLAKRGRLRTSLRDASFGEF